MEVRKERTGWRDEEISRRHRLWGVRFAVRYADDFSKFYVVPINAKSKEFLPKRTEMTESEFVALLYRMRNINLVAADVLDTINNTGVKSGNEQLILGF